ncbi:MAG: Ribonuclease HII [Chloroflexi bacterium]|nr:Ribonuclease HII [Chloroflexota bacterium]MBT9166059.1 Ribonuclease HII [Chloroflexota bacterium]
MPETFDQSPTFIEEEKLWQQGYQLVAGIDEVGRGPLAGPVVAAAVILTPASRLSWLLQLRDSKRLAPRKREFLSSCIQREALAVGIGVVPPETIDVRGIVAATRLAMRLAVETLSVASRPPDFLLIDWITMPELDIPQRSIIRGDNLSCSIAAASIVAKVHRDRLMMEYDGLYSGYGFARNKGYPTTEHLAKLRRLGCCPIHRASFAPVREVRERNG